uniref:Uncharacterized protein n=1 Tax=Cyanothece sp. (strain PCC 7425 / ATCC 29141) TaxID=395961 RepID=B8HTM1_CYAP4
MKEWYREDLAYIHDVGHSDYALKSAPAILDILIQNNIREGLVVDLGCGRRDEELHYLRLYKARDVAEKLRQIGFQVQIMGSYGQYELPKAHAAFIALKSG